MLLTGGLAGPDNTKWSESHATTNLNSKTPTAARPKDLEFLPEWISIRLAGWLSCFSPQFPAVATTSRQKASKKLELGKINDRLDREH